MVNHIFEFHKEEELPNIYQCAKKCKQSFPAPKLLQSHECVLFPIKTRNQNQNENTNDSTVEQQITEDFLTKQSEIDESKFETTTDQGN